MKKDAIVQGESMGKLAKEQEEKDREHEKEEIKKALREATAMNEKYEELKMESTPFKDFAARLENENREKEQEY